MPGIELIAVALSALTTAPAQVVLDDVQHVRVYSEAGRFGGWPQGFRI